MPGGRAPKQKGSRLERECVALLVANGLDAKRVPLSGSVCGFKGDVIVTLGDQQIVCECKARKKGFSFLYSALEGNDAAIFKTDRAEPLIVLPLWWFSSFLRRLRGPDAL